MPGRSSPPIPRKLSPQCAISALTSVPSRLLVDDDQVLIFEHDVERDRLALRLRRDGRRNDQHDRSPRLHLRRRIVEHGPAAGGHRARLD
jgi:hypothetical protein